MSRIRRYNGNNALTQTPPPELLPAALVALLDERTRVQREQSAASNEHADLRRHASEHDAQARRDDAAAAAEAARSGGPIGGTPNADALAERRRVAEQRNGALTDALATIEAEIRDAMMVTRESPEHLAAMQSARADLVKAGAAFDKALRKAARLAGVHDWFHQMPYDDSAQVHLLDVSPGADRSIGDAVLDLPPVDGFAAITALTTITDRALQEA